MKLIRFKFRDDKNIVFLSSFFPFNFIFPLCPNNGVGCNQQVLNKCKMYHLNPAVWAQYPFLHLTTKSHRNIYSIYSLGDSLIRKMWFSYNHNHIIFTVSRELYFYFWQDSFSYTESCNDNESIHLV